jgi:guanylate kinase
MRSGTLLVVSAPSGAGKTTLVRLLVERDKRVGLSVSHTTRLPRAGEQDGREYHFVDGPTFSAMRLRGDFVEWAEVHGNCYGTSRHWLEQRLQDGQDVLLEIDWQGASQVRQLFPEAVAIFVMPPSLEELESRLRGRGTDSDDVIARRLAVAVAEMRHVGEYDFVIINNDLQVALDDLLAAVQASRLRISCQQARHPDIFRILDQE